MKQNTPKMFKYGNIVNRVYFILSIVLLVIGLIAMIVAAANDEKQTLDSAAKCFGYGIHFLAATILCNIFVIKKAEKQIEEDYYRSLAPFITSIAFGVVSNNPFYVIAGIFGIVVNAQQKKNNQEQVEEKKEEINE